MTAADPSRCQTFKNGLQCLGVPYHDASMNATPHTFPETAEQNDDREPGTDDEAVTAADIRWHPGTSAEEPTTRPMLRCVCCKEFYRRGAFKCCAPPNGMSTQAWLTLACPMPKDGGCGKCWRHCQCPDKQKRLPPGPMAEWLAELAARLGKR